MVNLNATLDNAFPLKAFVIEPAIVWINRMKTSISVRSFRVPKTLIDVDMEDVSTWTPDVMDFKTVLMVQMNRLYCAGS